MANTSKTYFDIPKLSMRGPEQEDGSFPSLVLGFRDGVPRMKVYLGQGNGVLEWAAVPTEFMAFLDDFVEMCSAPGGTFIELDGIKDKWVDNKRTNETYVAVRMRVGKTKEGIMYLMLMQEGKPQIPFFFKRTKYHETRDIQKERVKDHISSVKLVKGYVVLVQDILANLLLQHANDNYDNGTSKPYPIPDRNGQTGGGKPTYKPQAKVESIGEMSFDLSEDVTF